MYDLPRYRPFLNDKSSSLGNVGLRCRICFVGLRRLGLDLQRVSCNSISAGQTFEVGTSDRFHYHTHIDACEPRQVKKYGYKINVPRPP